MTQNDGVKEWVDWIEIFVINDIRKALENDIMEVSLIILCLIGVETLSGYWAGKKADRVTFVSFMERYFPEVYSSYASYIYTHLRNGLLHDYVVKEIENTRERPFVMNRNADEPHLIPCKTGGDFPVWFNRERFARDFIAAWEAYRTDFSQDPELTKKIEARVSKRGYLVVADINQLIGKADTGAESPPTC